MQTRPIVVNEINVFQRRWNNINVRSDSTVTRCLVENLAFSHVGFYGSRVRNICAAATSNADFLRNLNVKRQGSFGDFHVHNNRC